MNKKIIFIVVGILILLVGSVSAPEAQDRTITRTASTQTVCDDNGKCTLTLYSGIRYAYEDEIWKPVEQARSLKGKGFDIVYLEDDKDFKLDALDFNLTSITLDFSTVEKEYNKDIPIRVWKHNQTKQDEACENAKSEYDFEVCAGEHYKEISDKKIDETERFTLESSRKTYEFSLDSILEFGFDSTTIMLQDADTENLEDARVQEDDADSNFGSNDYVYVREGSGVDQHAYFKFNLSSVPSGQVIDDSKLFALSFFGCGSGVGKDMFAYELDNQAWSEEVITWNNKPSVGNSLDSFSCFSGTGWWNWSVTSWVSSEYGNLKKNVSFVLKFGATSSWEGFFTKERSTTSQRPYLNITYSEAPAPIVNLDSPLNNTFNKTLNQYFNASYSATAGGLVNATLFIWNSTSYLVYNMTNISTGTSNASRMNFTFTYDDAYLWNYYVCDDSVLCAWTLTNWTLTIDTTPPVFTNLINLTADANSSFSYDIDATDATSSVSCFTVNDTDFQIDCNGVLQNNTVLNEGTYWLNITVNDSANNLNSQIIYVNTTVWDTILKWDWGALMTDSSLPDKICLLLRNSEFCIDSSTFFIDTVLGRVGIGTSAPTHKLNVVGSGNFTGNITAENVFLPAYVSSHTNNTIAVASAGVWYNVTFDHEVDEFKKRITHVISDATNTTFTIVDTGVYEITYTMSFQDSAIVPTSHIVARVTKDNVELNGFTIEEDLGIKDQDKTMHHSDLVGLVAGEEIVLSFTSDDTTVLLTSHLTYGIHGNTAHLTIKRIA